LREGLTKKNILSPKKKKKRRRRNRVGKKSHNSEKWKRG